MQASTPHGFNQTILPLQARLYARALKNTAGNEAEAQDLLQDTLVRAYRFWHSFDPGTNALKWAYTILRHTFLNRCNASNRRRDIYAAHRANAELAESPNETVEARETRQRVREALQQIPEQFRLAVTLVDLEGYSTTEAAEMLGCKPGTVNSRAYRGREKLAKILAA